MRRKHFFELADSPYFPKILRILMGEYLRFATSFTQLYHPIIPLLQKVLQDEKRLQIIELGAGAGSALCLLTAINEKRKVPIHWILTDKFPLQIHKTYLEKQSSKVYYVEKSVDILNLEDDFEGVFAMFTTFHHFAPQEAIHVLQQLSAQNQPIAIFEGGSRRWFDILYVGIFPFFAIFLISPFIKPFRISRLILTYFIPILPLVILFDGVVSMFRQYQPEELLAFAKSANKSYHWESAQITSGLTMVSYLIGYPNKN